MKNFFKRRIPNKFTITPINFGLEGIVYPLLLCLNRNSDGLLTNLLFFLGLSVGGKRYIHISTIYPKRGGKILGLRGFHILQLVWCFCYNSFNSWNILVYRIWSYMSELLWNKYNQPSANGHSDCSTYWHFWMNVSYQWLDPCVCAKISGIATGQTLHVTRRKYKTKGCFDIRKKRFLIGFLLRSFIING